MKFARNHITIAAVVLLIAFVGLAACAPAAAPPPPSPEPTTVPAATSVPPTAAATTAPPPAPKPVTLQVIKNDKFGSFLADGDGRTLYLFTKDTKDTSNCYDKCAAAWPALLPDGKPTLKDGVSADLVGGAQRKEGVSQLSYNGWPLYYYTPDKNPGDMNGQGVGNVWWLVSPEGNAIKPAALSLAKDSKLGSFLADDKGRSLYLFTKDTKDTSNCYGKCEQSWPPLLMLDKPKLGDGINEALLGSTSRKDGSMQVTYNGWPLYYFAADAAAGDVKGQAVGKVWWVISAEGNAIKPAALALAKNDKLGNFIADDQGRTLYIFTKDTKDTSNCYDKCEQAWPPLLMLDKPTLGDGIKADLLGSTTRKDGTVQVTYNGMPLYYYAKDQAPGDTTGQGVGTVWYVIMPDGNPEK